MIYSKYSGAVCLVVFLPLILTAQRAQENVVPLKNWATPLYWHANQAEAAARASSQNAAPQLQFSTNQVSADALTFVAITPCRLVDTRGAAAGFNGDITPFAGPSIVAGQTVTFPVQSSSEATANTAPAPCGVIPSIAEAYSFNVTVIPHAAGVVDYISIWPAGAAQPVVSTLNDLQGQIVANAAIVPAGTSADSGGVSVYNSGPATTDVIIDMNGFFTAPTDLNYNTAIGSGTLADDTTGFVNTAIGYDALTTNTSGYGNTAMGGFALGLNTIGIENTATGNAALAVNTSGSENTASGLGALRGNTTGSFNTAAGNGALGNNTTGNNNTASGSSALTFNKTGGNNTALGYEALAESMTGSGNIAIGFEAGFNAPAANNNSIYIGNAGSASDSSGTTQIGFPGTTSFFVAGVSGVTTGISNAVPVVIDSNGQLGTISSSQRFKEDIQDMGDASNDLLRLRPVTFRYKQAYKDGSKPMDYGLIAEEVADVYPDLVVRNKDGEIQTVQYQKLTPMLLNEVQKLHADLDQQNQRVQQQDETIRQLQDRLAALETLLRPY
jgi:hypothetical protein